MDRIRRVLEKNVKISDNDWQVFSGKLITQTFPKKTLLLKQGQIEKHLSFIEKGIIRFFIPGDEKEITFSFSFENSFVSAYDSFLTQTPCTYQVETLSETVLSRLTYTDLQQIYKETTAGNIVGRLSSEDLFLRKARRELTLLKDTAERRYLRLFEERPELMKSIPMKYIASYIGITPQALSRIRARIS